MRGEGIFSFLLLKVKFVVHDVRGTSGAGMEGDKKRGGWMPLMQGCS